MEGLSQLFKLKKRMFYEYKSIPAVCPDSPSSEHLEVLDRKEDDEFHAACIFNRTFSSFIR